MARTLRNENGDTISVSPGDIVRMRSGNQYLMVEVPGSGEGPTAPADWPTGIGVTRGGTEYQEILLDRIHQVTPRTEESRAVAQTLVHIEPDRLGNQIAGAFRSTGARGGSASGFARNAAPASQSGSGNS